METYTLLRAFADSWMLLMMTLFFIGVVIWAFRPGSKKTHQDAATAIFRNEDRPARDPRDAKSGSSTFKEAWK